ncbi:hypothetical protein AVEN_248290-1, partial [Araneus ventricosus]
MLVQINKLHRYYSEASNEDGMLAEEHFKKDTSSAAVAPILTASAAISR